MACFAVAVASATVPNEQVRALIEQNHPGLMEFLQKLLKGKNAQVSGGNGAISIYLNGEWFTVYGARLTQTGTSRQGANFKEIMEAMSFFGQKLMAEQIAAQFGEGAEIVPTEVTDSEGNALLAYLIKYALGPLQGRVFVLPEGKFQIMVDSGEFAQGKSVIEALVEQMNAGGVEARLTGEVESHRTNTTHVHQAQRYHVH